MVVAARAGHRQALGAAHDDVDAVVDDVRSAVEEASSQRQEAQGGEIAVVLGVLDELIRGDLQAQELIVGQVLVEGVHDPVAVGVGVRVATLFLEDVTLRVGVARDVQPVAAPAFAEGGCGEQAVDEFLGRLRILVTDVSGDLGRGRVISPERDRESADDDFARGLRIEVQAGGFQLREHEAVERLVDLGCVGRGDDGSVRRLHRLEGPVLARVLREGFRFLRPGQTLADPFAQGGDGLGRKLFIFARHRVDIRRLDVVDGLNEPADLGLARHDDRSEFAAFEDEFPGI